MSEPQVYVKRVGVGYSWWVRYLTNHGGLLVTTVRVCRKDGWALTRRAAVRRASTFAARHADDNDDRFRIRSVGVQAEKQEGL